MRLSEFLGISSYISNGYVLALINFILLLLVLRILLYILEKIVLKFTVKTKTEVDDILLRKASIPLTVLALLFSLRVSIQEMPLSEALMLNLTNGIWSVLVIVVAYLVYVIFDIVLIRLWIKTKEKTKIKIDENLSGFLHGAMKIILIVLAAIYILDLWGIEVVPLLGALGIAGIAVALALQPVLSNVFSGVAMILDKSVRVGDWIILEDKTWGVIEKVGIRSTKIKSFDNDLIVIPNSKMANSKIQNVSLPEPKARVVVPFGVAYGSDVDKVKSLVLAEIKKVDGALKDPKPFVRFMEMGDSALNFKAFFHVETFEKKYSALDEANTRVYNALNKAGISIPFPQMDVHVKK